MKYMILTFDDGHESHYNNVIPLLKKYNINAVFCIITSLFDTFWSQEKISILLNNGNIIFSHTENHINLKTQYDENDIIASIKKIKNLQLCCIGFASPYYSKNSNVYKLLNDIGTDYSYISQAISFKKAIYQSKNKFNENKKDLLRYGIRDSSGHNNIYDNIVDIINHMTDDNVITLTFHKILKKEEKKYNEEYVVDYEEFENILVFLSSTKNIKICLPHQI